MTGRDCDREFLTLMTAHHRGVIDMAKPEQARRCYAPAQLTDNIVGGQSARSPKWRAYASRYDWPLQPSGQAVTA